MWRVCLFICTPARVYMCLNVYVCLLLLMWVIVSMHMCALLCSCMYIYVSVCMRVCMCACVFLCDVYVHMCAPKSYRSISSSGCSRWAESHERLSTTQIWVISFLFGRWCRRDSWLLVELIVPASYLEQQHLNSPDFSFTTNCPDMTRRKISGCSDSSSRVVSRKKEPHLK